MNERSFQNFEIPGNPKKHIEIPRISGIPGTLTSLTSRTSRTREDPKWMQESFTFEFLFLEANYFWVCG